MIAVISASTPLLAAPPGILQWQTLASPGEGCSSPSFLSTIGFITQTGGVNCTGLQSTDPTMVSLDYLLDGLCSIQLYADSECSILQVDIETSTDGRNQCLSVPEGFRGLSVTC